LDDSNNLQAIGIFPFPKLDYDIPNALPNNTLVLPKLCISPLARRTEGVLQPNVMYLSPKSKAGEATQPLEAAGLN
jgi:hypothetical protein